MFNLEVFKIKSQIERLIREHENTAEEYFQEVGDEDKGNEFLAKSAALKELFDWIVTEQDIPKHKIIEK